MKRDNNLTGFHDPDSGVPLDDPESTLTIEWDKDGRIGCIGFDGPPEPLEDTLDGVADLLNHIIFNDNPFIWEDNGQRHRIDD